MAGLGSYDYGDSTIKESLQGKKNKKGNGMKIKNVFKSKAAYEKSPLDKTIDKKLGLKEGSKADNKMDSKVMKAVKKGMPARPATFLGGSAKIMGMSKMVNKTNMRKKGK